MRSIGITVGLLALAALTALAGAAPRTLDLSPEQRRSLSRYFGDALKVKAIEARPIEDPRAYLKQEDGAKWHYRVTHGDRQGQTGTATLSRTGQDGATSGWRFDTGGNSVMELRFLADGSYVTHATQDRKNKVISRYDPPEPLLLAGLKPGETRTMELKVGVYDDDQPDRKSHDGTLAVTYRYVGAFEVTVPAGTFETVLLHWVYTGKVGPANVEDVQYWFLAKGMGPVAMVEKSDVSAFLVYQDHEKRASVLTKAP